MYSHHPIEHPGRGYVVAIAASLMVVVVRFTLEGVLGGFVPFIPFTAAVSIAAWYGGLKPGLVAVALGAVAADSLFVSQRYALSVDAPRAAVGLAIFAVAGTLISWLCELLHRARRRLESERERLRASAVENSRMRRALEVSEARERTRAAQLEVLTGALAESDRCKNEFLSTLSQELRNPLIPVRNLVHILRAKAVSAPDLQWIPEFIERQVGQMNRLVDDLTGISGVGCDAQIAVVCERHGAEIEIRFHDRGVGVSAEMLERIFQPFNHLDHSGVPGRSQKIGLAHATRLVLLHGGSIDAHSDAVGPGSVLCVRLPVLPARPPLGGTPTR